MLRGRCVGWWLSKISKVFVGFKLVPGVLLGTHIPSNSTHFCVRLVRFIINSTKLTGQDAVFVDGMDFLTINSEGCDFVGWVDVRNMLHFEGFLFPGSVLCGVASSDGVAWPIFAFGRDWRNGRSSECAFSS